VRDEPSAEAAALPRPPRWLPPQLLDGVVVGVVALLTAGLVAGQVVLHGPPGHKTFGPATWTWRTVAGAACVPAALLLWQRRRPPLGVLVLALTLNLALSPFPSLLAMVALYSAATRLPTRSALLAWAAASACFAVGRAVAGGSPLWSDLASSVANAGLVTATGLYVGARRAYVDRLRERALFARALAAFLPPAVAELVQASPAALSLNAEVEATVVFSDLRGFSTLAERLAPRQVGELLRLHLGAMAEVVATHAGTLDKFAGDAVMAVFGAPRPLQDHAERTQHCAVAMQQRQARLNAEAARLDLPACQIGIGINSGKVIAGTVGGPGRLDYTVLGDAVNVAQRLQSQALAGEILASAATMQLASPHNAEPAGMRRLKGRDQLVEAYRILWATSPAAEDDVPAAGEDPRGALRDAHGSWHGGDPPSQEVRTLPRRSRQSPPLCPPQPARAGQPRGRTITTTGRPRPVGPPQGGTADHDHSTSP
jgi:class 3 adenylate cyclase